MRSGSPSRFGSNGVGSPLRCASSTPTRMPQREGQRHRGGRVRPLRIIDGDEDGTVGGEALEQRPHRRPEQAGLEGPRAGGGPQQRRVERRALEGWKRGARTVHDGFGEVGQRGQRQVRLGGGALGEQRHEPTLPGAFHGLAHQRRLADPGLTPDEEPGRRTGRRVEEGVDDTQLGVPPDDLHGLRVRRPRRQLPAAGRA